MQQEPIMNHGTLIDTYNYGALIRSQSDKNSQRVIGSRPSKKFRPKSNKKKSNSRSKAKVLRKNNTQNK